MTVTLLSTAGLRQHVETDLPDTALQLILDSEEAEIIRRYGPHATATDVLSGGEWFPLQMAGLSGVTGWLVLNRPAVSIVSIVQTTFDQSLVLAAGDYTLWPGGRLEREGFGPNPASWWGEQVVVTYVPVDMTAQRALVLVQLCKLALAFTGLKSESVGGGDHSETTADYTVEREKALRSLAPRGGFVIA